MNVRTGAAGAIGIAAAATSKPDGYTLLVTISSFSTVPEVDALFKRPQAFTREQFIPIARLTADPPLLVANPAAQWRSVKELVAAARKRPCEVRPNRSCASCAMRCARWSPARNTGRRCPGC